MKSKWVKHDPQLQHPRRLFSAGDFLFQCWFSPLLCLLSPIMGMNGPGEEKGDIQYETCVHACPLPILFLLISHCPGMLCPDEQFSLWFGFHVSSLPLWDFHLKYWINGTSIVYSQPPCSVQKFLSLWKMPGVCNRASLESQTLLSFPLQWGCGNSWLVCCWLLNARIWTLSLPLSPIKLPHDLELL